MKLETAQFIQEYIDYDAIIHEEYSGRGMYGESTVGIVLTMGLQELSGAILEAILDTPDVLEGDLDLYGVADDLKTLRIDTLGYDEIIY